MYINQVAGIVLADVRKCKKFKVKGATMAGRRSMDETPTFGQRLKWTDYVTKWEWDEKGGFRLARLFGDVWMDYIHTVETKNGKFYPEFCHGWDVDNCAFYPDKEDRCPCCSLQMKGGYRYYMNIIDIESEENKPSRPKPDWSPIRFIDMSTTLFTRVKELKTVNKGVSVADGPHGAIIQMKYNGQLDPGSQYSATMDTKDVPITDEQKEYIVTQKYPDGSSKIVRGVNGMPAQFEYIRCISSRDEMIKSLRRNGYYDSNDSEESTGGHSFDDNKQISREENIAQIDAETPIETINLDNIFPGGDPIMPAVDEEPAPKKAPAKSKEPYDECPTEFGKFANHMDCFTKCGVNEACKKETSSKATVAKAETKKKVVVVPDEDDDTV